MGRPRTKVNWREIYNYAMLGATLDDICLMSGISEKTLRKCLKEDTEFDTISEMMAEMQGKGNITSSLRLKLINKALVEGDTQALIHLDKSHRFGKNMDEYQAQQLKLKDKEITTNAVVIEKALGDAPSE